MNNLFEQKLVGVSLSFNDVLLVPQYSTIKSREHVDLSTQLTPRLNLSHPIIPTNMSTITEFDMISTLHKSGGIAFLHRFMPYDQIENIISKCKDNDFDKIVVSVGVKNEDKDYVLSTKNLPQAWLIDIAHGDSDLVIDMIKLIRDTHGDNVDIIAGNVATGEGYTRLAMAGADAVRVGISGGKVCTTKFITGHGMPTLASVMSCKVVQSGVEYALNKKVPIIADGGINSSGDIVKALAFGASAVCVGSLMAGTSSTPGNIIEVDGKSYKEYFGMSSAVAIERHKGGLRRGIAAEGIDKLVECKGETQNVLDKLIGGVKSGFSYSNAMNIDMLQKNFQFQVLSPGSVTNKNNNWD